MSEPLYPNERAVLRVFATVDGPLTEGDVAHRLRAGASPRLAVGVGEAVKSLVAAGYVVEVDGFIPEYAVTSFGRFAIEEMA